MSSGELIYIKKNTTLFNFLCISSIFLCYLSVFYLFGLGLQHPNLPKLFTMLLLLIITLSSRLHKKYKAA